MQLTEWFPADLFPIRDGVYIVRNVIHGFPSECWHACRWDGKTMSWYAADTIGNEQQDVIGWDRPNNHRFQWRGLASDPKGK